MSGMRLLAVIAPYKLWNIDRLYWRNPRRRTS